MTDEERRQVEIALNAVQGAVDNWSPDDDSKVPPGQQWLHMLNSWAIIGGIIRQTMAPPPQQVMPHVVAGAAAANGESAEQTAAEPVDG